MTSNVLDSPLLTVEEVAQALRLSPHAVRSKLRSGALQGLRVGDGPKAHYRIERRELERFLHGDEPDRGEAA